MTLVYSDGDDVKGEAVMMQATYREAHSTADAFSSETQKRPHAKYHTAYFAKT